MFKKYRHLVVAIIQIDSSVPTYHIINESFKLKAQIKNVSSKPRNVDIKVIIVPEEKGFCVNTDIFAEYIKFIQDKFDIDRLSVYYMLTHTHYDKKKKKFNVSIDTNVDKKYLSPTMINNRTFNFVFYEEQARILYKQNEEKLCNNVFSRRTVLLHDEGILLQTFINDKRVPKDISRLILEYYHYHLKPRNLEKILYNTFYYPHFKTGHIYKKYKYALDYDNGTDLYKLCSNIRPQNPYRDDEDYTNYMYRDRFGFY